MRTCVCYLEIQQSHMGNKELHASRMKDILRFVSGSFWVSLRTLENQVRE